MRRLILIVAANLMLFPAVAPADPVTPPAPDEVTVTGKRPDQDKTVCRSDVTTGSIIPKRVCKTKGEWEEIRQRGLAQVQRLKDDRAREQHVRDSVENR